MRESALWGCMEGGERRMESKLQSMSGPALCGMLMVQSTKSDAGIEEESAAGCCSSSNIEEVVYCGSKSNMEEESVLFGDYIHCAIPSPSTSTDKADLLSLSPSITRSSGRSVKKNYLQMLQQPLVLDQKSSNNNDEKQKRNVNSGRFESRTPGTRVSARLRKENVNENDGVLLKDDTNLVEKYSECESGHNTEKVVFDSNYEATGTVLGAHETKPSNLYTMSKDEEESTVKQGAIESKLCLKCGNAVEQRTLFVNCCSSCASEAQRIMAYVKKEEDLACVGTPPCWSQSDSGDSCDACIMQRYIESGLEWNMQHRALRSLTVEKLRSPEMVLRAQLRVRAEGRKLLSSWSKAVPSRGGCSWCTVEDTEPLSLPCQWDITVFKQTSSRERLCKVCKLDTNGDDWLYEVLPRAEHVTCHQCLLRAFQASRDSGGGTGCAVPCPGVPQCDHCVLQACQSFFPLAAVRYRYKRPSGSQPCCRLCGQDDEAALETVRGSVSVWLCLLCLWRIRTHSLPPPPPSVPPTCGGSCSPEDCDCCLTVLASRVASLPQIVIHRPARTLSSAAAPSSSASRPKSKSKSSTSSRQSLESRANFTLPDSAAPSCVRQKRLVKPTQFNDFFVGDKSISKVLRGRSGTSVVPLSSPLLHSNSNSNTVGVVATVGETLSEDGNREKKLQEEEEEELGGAGDTEPGETGKKRRSRGQPSCGGDKKKKTAVTPAQEQEEEQEEQEEEEEEQEEEEEEDEEEELPAEPPVQRRIKQAVKEVCLVSTMRPGGPRVKQVSRLSVTNTETSSRQQKCLIKKKDRDKDDTTEEAAVFNNGDCGDEQRSCDEDQLEIDNSSSVNNKEHLQNSAAHHNTHIMNTSACMNEKMIQNVPEDTSTKTFTRSAVIINNQLPQDLDVYRDSDSDDIASEEENIDPDLDSINTVKGEVITAALAHDGGYPIVTTHLAMPVKVLCYSCGSGGEQMIHCVSCAEPFHFFCIEFQFRPKSKEMFVCRNCTKCHCCKDFGSDLKCIKCQLGFHPACVDKYPPSRSEDKSNWACYKCAMCLHCGTKAEEAMSQLGSESKQIDWAKDPWQCGRCSRARQEGHVCPECGRAYQDGLETVRCGSCCKHVHRQCAGLTEDEYELQKGDKRPGGAHECSKCTAARKRDSEDSAEAGSRRVSHKRQCKESTSLKDYCEKKVKRHMGDFLQQAELREEQVLEEHNLAEGTVAASDSAHVISLDQFDGAGNEEEEEEDSSDLPKALSSPNNEITDRDLQSILCDSSESVADYDFDPLVDRENDPEERSQHIDLDPPTRSPPRAKVGIFSRLSVSDYLTPSHMIMDSLARIIVKLCRYPAHSLTVQVYNDFLLFLQKLTNEVFPWIDFDQCLNTVHDVVKRNSSRIRLVLKVITDIVTDGLRREFEVFSASVWDIEEKLHSSLVRGREEFIIFHSEQHLSALMYCLETTVTSVTDSTYSKYRMAFPVPGKDPFISERDLRRCALCNCPGDDGLEGRLIYGTQDVWVHVNCALWSDEVYEKDDGALVNVNAAIERGRKTICASCNNYGATVRCSAEDSIDGFNPGCTNCYHFSCAFNSLTDPVFTESRTFYCSEFHEKTPTETQLGLADMLILRRIYMPLTGLSKLSCAQPRDQLAEDIVITVGTLRIDCLGTLEQHSDASRLFLCPINLRARRLFWSMSELDSLVMYYMYIKDEPNKHKTNATGMPAVPNKLLPLNPSFPLKRRRVIDTPDSRLATKRSRPLEMRHEVYEMDDYGDLIKANSTPAQTKDRSSPQALVTPELQRVNRRFPREDRCRRTSGVVNKVTVESPLSYSEPVGVTAEPQPVLPPPTPSSSCTMPKIITVARGNTVPQTNNIRQQYQQQYQQQYHNNNNNNNNIFQMVPINNCQRNIPTALLHVPFRQPATHSHQVPLQQQPLSQQHTLLQRVYPSSASSSLITNTTVQGRTFQRPATIIKVPAQRLMVNQQQQQPQRIIKVTPLGSVGRPVSYVQEQPQSVLRTVLTHSSLTPPQPQQYHSVANGSQRGSSSYTISSSGSLPEGQRNNCYLGQFDGEADDSVSSVCSDQDTSSVVASSTATKARANNNTSNNNRISEYNSVLKFGIEGFTESLSPKSVWTYILRRVTQMRELNGFTEYPLKRDGWTKFGINHRYVVFLVEQMIGASNCVQYTFKYRKTAKCKLRDQYVDQSLPLFNGCRFIPWRNNQPDHIVRDPLAFLRCKSNRPLKNHAPDTIDTVEDLEPSADYIQTLASQFRLLKSGALARVKNVGVCVSEIHSRGLFARREFAPHEIIIEYVGETIRSILSDVREVQYQKSGVDCYMFRLDQDTIVDATYKGNAARFINHSCQPNCYAKVVKLEGDKHIVIIAQRRIYKGEELTYDYRFPIEDDKLACTCGSRRCRKFLN